MKNLYKGLSILASVGAIILYDRFLNKNPLTYSPKYIKKINELLAPDILSEAEEYEIIRQFEDVAQSKYISMIIKCRFSKVVRLDQGNNRLLLFKTENGNLLARVYLK